MPKPDIARQFPEAYALLRRRLAKAKARCGTPGYEHVTFDFASPAEAARQLLEHLGPTPGEKFVLDRISPDGPYAPWNLRYADTTLSAYNRRCVLRGWRSRWVAEGGPD